MYFRLTIELGTATMETGADLANALTTLAAKLHRPESVSEEWDDYDRSGKVRAEDGLTVGHWKLTVT